MATHATLTPWMPRLARCAVLQRRYIQGFSHFSGIALAGGRIYVPTLDGTPVLLQPRLAAAVKHPPLGISPPCLRVPTDMLVLSRSTEVPGT